MRRWPWILAVAAGCVPDAGPTVIPADVGTDEDADGVSVEEGDCDDSDDTIYPGAPEVDYDGVDQDCRGDDDFDHDGDGAPGGPSGTDCADDDATVAPGLAEHCNGIDDDCDGEIDEDAVDPAPLYTDNDGDGFGVGGEVGSACSAVWGTTFVPGDCDDLDADVFPGQAELCNTVDDDCNGLADDAPVDGFTLYGDADGDGYGSPSTPITACATGQGTSGTASDCDDTDALTHPTATELCDRRDNDCNGTVDDGATVDRTWYPDADGDGDGSASGSEASCDRPSGYVDTALDCDDTDSARFPGNVETCNGRDDDCTGYADDNATDATWVYPDRDLDGYGDASAGTLRCTIPSGYIEDGSDCDDSTATISPLATELCNLVDDNCDGATDERTAADARTFYEDNDGDGFGTPASTTPSCWLPHGFAAVDADCDDADAGANPGASERCDEVDNDCDGAVDEDATDAGVWYADADGDGFGAGAGVASCDPPGSGVEDGRDCDDTTATTWPGAAELDNGLDDDCDDLVDEDFATPGLLVVSEITRQPYAGGTGTSIYANAQWFEVYNPASAALDLSGWTVTEQDGDEFTVPSGYSVLPHGYFVFCYDDATFANPALCDYTWGDPAHGAPYYDTTFYFDRDEDLIALWSGATLVDEVHWYYDATNGYWPRDATYSMRLDDDALSSVLNDDPDAWCDAETTTTWSSSSYPIHDLGTPRAGNGSCD